MMRASGMKDLTHTSLTLEQCRLARLSRDVRFDGQFFIGVKTTGIFCRPICPARLPKEENVEYFASRMQAVQQGYRPCLRCRPDSAPQSWAWKGVETTFVRARKLLEESLAEPLPIASLADRLGVSERYLRQLFAKYLGVSPKQYQLYQQLLFAKQLLHDSDMSMTDIAFAAGFNSVRRFNDAFKQHFRLPPTAVRKAQPASLPEHSVRIPVRGNIDWPHQLNFYRLRAITGIEQVDDTSYSRTAEMDGEPVWFALQQHSEHAMLLRYRLNNPALLYRLLQQVRRVFDLDTHIDSVEQHLQSVHPQLVHRSGIRIPGVWSPWEAGIRAILGQQISLTAAVNLLNQWVQLVKPEQWVGFPTPEQAIQADMSALKMPQRRKQTLKSFAEYCCHAKPLQESELLQISGIGPWTVNYIKMRGWLQPDCLLPGDLVVKKQLEKIAPINPDRISPWGSYATLQLWSR